MKKNDIKNIAMINDFLSKRPETLGVFGYGSGVIKQVGYNDFDKLQIDLMVAVKDDKEWHKKNIQLNPSDYSFTGKVFFNNAPETWYHLGSDICYITNIEHGNQTYKMGVINKKNLINDLLHWQTFYLAGRFQKPMLSVKSDKEIDDAIKTNQKNALIAALLLLDEDHQNINDLYNKICSLSYIGDTRMGIAENPNKVKNIVNGSFDEINKIYSSFNIFDRDATGIIVWDNNKIIDDIESLPLNIKKPTNKEAYTKEELRSIRNDIEQQLAIKNSNVSAAQTLKGILTAGPYKSIGYAYKKVKKHSVK